MIKLNILGGKLNKTICTINSIIKNESLSKSIYKSIKMGVDNKFCTLDFSEKVINIFHNTLENSIRNIEKHPKGVLLKRFIEFGPKPNKSTDNIANKKLFLSNNELIDCLNFIHGHIINSFKGELAELLSIKPCLELLKKLKKNNKVSKGVELILGNEIKEKCILKKKRNIWGYYLKGADGLFVEKKIKGIENNNRISVCGIIEIKSMYRSKKAMLCQVENHIKRLNGGIKINNIEYFLNGIHPKNPSKPCVNSKNKYIKILILPNQNNILIDYSIKESENGHIIETNENKNSSIYDIIEEIDKDVWKITLNWSEEYLEKAAYEMAGWYMSEIGEAIFEKKVIPKEWKNMTGREIGLNNIKMMLYYTLLCEISVENERTANKLYNIFSFGYKIGKEHKEMLWFEDL